MDAYGKMATMLGYPAELLWAKVPGLTQQDVDEATDLAAQKAAEGGPVGAAFRILSDAERPNLTVAG